ncbi:hypothetical protein I5172_06490 [Enterococcus faecium]|uniref:hypothetical protein n=1 Tax=Enterococcus TaxID=1350 RepID=UPI0002A2D44D|nr:MULTISPECIES: hypothetical protein [Enterococcus]EKC6761633.1 hypothetical protein [Enterococcus faecium]ELA74401.1 hypothetical protein OGS_02841 [Enterococcus faecium EnGen0002]ELA74780.1 hypothetical protein OGS_03013 [Enterococcus faecium EnGen0002]MBG0287365.1 hypothetical protein [Enterococcus faecium]MBG0304167.1 hypothetical protein [Enterococcus faecium]
MYADKNEIEWLLFESGISVKDIYMESGVARTTVIDLINKTSSIDKMRFDNAVKLTKMAKMRKNLYENK